MESCAGAKPRTCLREFAASSSLVGGGEDIWTENFENLEVNLQRPRAKLHLH